MAVIVKWNAAVEVKRDGGLTSRNEYAKLFCDSWKLLHVNARKRKSRLETGSREPSAGVRRTRGTAELASEQPAQEGKILCVSSVGTPPLPEKRSAPPGVK